MTETHIVTAPMRPDLPVPTARLAWLAVLGVPLSLLGLFGAARLGFALAYDLILVAAAAFDLIAAGPPAWCEVRRELPLRWVQGRADRVRLTVRCRRARPLRLTLRDVPPPSFRIASSRFDLTVAPRRPVQLHYDAVPAERGDHRFGPIVARSRGPLGLIERQTALSVGGEGVRVYPDLVSLSAREAGLARPGAWIAGAHRGRTPGEGREFHQLRDYSAGDDARLVD
jgi:uncharacterized protein (DUF58 family)